MTKEELELEAEEWVKKDCCNDCCAQNCKDWCREVKHKYRAYLASAEPREKRIAELEAQIEKMKCCSNCAFQLVIGGVRDRHCVKCNSCSEWELED